jgi:hypothetical protein
MVDRVEAGIRERGKCVADHCLRRRSKIDIGAGSAGAPEACALFGGRGGSDLRQFAWGAYTSDSAESHGGAVGVGDISIRRRDDAVRDLRAGDVGI